MLKTGFDGRKYDVTVSMLGYLLLLSKAILQGLVLRAIPHRITFRGLVLTQITFATRVSESERKVKRQKEVVHSHLISAVLNKISSSRPLEIS